MLFYTNTADAPWTMVKSDDRWRARLNPLRFVLASLPDPLITGSITAALGQHAGLLDRAVRRGGRRESTRPRETSR